MEDNFYNDGGLCSSQTSFYTSFKGISRCMSIVTLNTIYGVILTMLSSNVVEKHLQLGNSIVPRNHVCERERMMIISAGFESCMAKQFSDMQDKSDL